MASGLAAFLATATLFLHHHIVFTKGQATVTAYCDDFGEIRHDNGAGLGFVLDAERKSGDSGDWSTAITAVIDDITPSTIIRVRCNDFSTNGGFIGQVTYKGSDYYSTNPISSGYWTVTDASQGSTTALTYVQKGSCCALVDDNAYWIWNGNDGDTLTFDLDISLLPTIEPTKAPSKQPSSAPTIEPSVSPITRYPTVQPTQLPTIEPTLAPTNEPTIEPTMDPTTEPTVVTQAPSNTPTIATTEAEAHTSAGSDAESSEEEDVDTMEADIMQMMIDNWMMIAICGGVLCIILVIALYFKCRTGKVKLYKPNMQEDDVVMSVLQQQKQKKSTIGSVSDVDDDTPGLFRRETRPESVHMKRVKSQEEEEEEIKIEVDDNMFQRTLTQIYGEDKDAVNPVAAKKALAPMSTTAPPTMASAPVEAPIPASVPTAAAAPAPAPIPAAVPTAAPIPILSPLAPKVVPIVPKTPPPPQPPSGVAAAMIPAAPLASNEDELIQDQCTDCGQTKSGKTYDADGSFYCMECWKNYA